MNAKVPTLSFYVDYKEDLRYVLSRLTHLDPAGMEYRVKQKGLDADVVRKILETDDKDKQRRIFDKYLGSVYKEKSSIFEEIKDEYNNIWSEKSPMFFEKITSLMGGLKWKFDDYHFLVSSFYSKASWGTSNLLAVWWKRDPKTKHYMNAYELVLTHFFETVDILYNERPIPDDKLWAIAEILAYIYVFRVPEIVDSFWPWIKQKADSETAYDHFYNGSYKQLGKPAQEIHTVFESGLSYTEFVKESVSILDEYPVDYLNNPL